MRWAYGITTVPQRLRDTLPFTIKSLAASGFDCPRLFIDGAKSVRDYSEWALPITCRWPGMKIYGNWILGMMELYIRDPGANRYAMFQDDLVCCLNLKQYLSLCPYPEMGYWNLYNVPQNEQLKPEGYGGWYPSNQMGRGALALVFSRDALVTLFQQPHLIERARSVFGWKSIDGTIIDSLKKIGWKEYVHKPSLVQHIGKVSTLQNHMRAISNTFQGEDFDPMQLCGTKNCLVIE